MTNNEEMRTLAVHSNNGDNTPIATINLGFIDDNGRNNVNINGSQAENGNGRAENARTSEEYDPYKNRQVEHPTTDTETLLHLLKGSLGTGILAMPNAFQNSGYIVGAICTIIIGYLCTYCIHILVKSAYEMCKRRKIPAMSYQQVAVAAMEEGPGISKLLAPYAGHCVNAFLLVYQIGTCCVYVVFVSENLKSVIDYYIGSDTNVKIYMVAILLPLILINWVRNLKFLAPFSTVANGITVVSFAIILYYIFREPVTLEGKHAVGSVLTFPLFFGTVLFALEAIGVMLPLENEMKTPQNFGGTTGVLNKGMVIIVVLYVAMGLFGYLRFGESVAGSITLNLPSDTEILAKIVQITLAIAIFVTHALACYVAIDLTWEGYVKKNVPANKQTLWEYVVRTVLVLITFLLAVAVPALEHFIALFGALCLSALGLAFPAIIETCVWWDGSSVNKKAFMIVKNGIIVIVGILGLITGTATSLEAIYSEFA